VRIGGSLANWRKRKTAISIVVKPWKLGKLQIFQNAVDELVVQPWGGKKSVNVRREEARLKREKRNPRGRIALNTRVFTPDVGGGRKQRVVHAHAQRLSPKERSRTRVKWEK